jgi:hypothetical protein
MGLKKPNSGIGRWRERWFELLLDPPRVVYRDPQEGNKKGTLELTPNMVGSAAATQHPFLSLFLLVLCRRLWCLFINETLSLVFLPFLFVCERSVSHYRHPLFFY